jgi:ADP-ribosyl-[dinitrogen reductase] hydrolase
VTAGPDPLEPDLDRFLGCLLGLAAGDALGTTLEFKSPGTFEPITDMVGRGPFRLAAGQWTDDTSMALCLAESLIECGGFDARDQMERYVRWWREGHLSPTGECFDIGGTVSTALGKFLSYGDPYAGSTDPHSAGNGSLMRLAPVPMFWASDPLAAIERSAESSRTTHGALTCVDACRYMGGLIVGALAGASKADLLSDRYAPPGAEGVWDEAPLCPEIDSIAAGSFKEKSPPAIRGKGYVVDCLEAALWAFHTTDSFEAGALAAVNLGDDADTTGAVYGQLAGAFNGAGGIPDRWLEKLAMRELIEDYAARLAEGPSPSST